MSNQFSIQIHCEDPWFSFIEQGLKPVEGRKNTHRYKKIKVNDVINFTNGIRSFNAQVTELRHYHSLEEYLEDVTLPKALPGITSLDEALAIYSQWSTSEDIQKYGFLGIFVKPL